jgi:hypothetical protein
MTRRGCDFELGNKSGLRDHGGRMWQRIPKVESWEYSVRQHGRGKLNRFHDFPNVVVAVR